MRDASTESQSETVVCEHAAFMMEAQRLKSGYALLCLDALQLVSDTDLRDRLTAEAEMGGDAAKEAKCIVKICDGCDDNGNRLKGVDQCPKETTDRVEEWLRKVVPVHLFYR